MLKLDENQILSVSILIPFYNEERYIDSAIRSILEYDYSGNLLVSVIAVNDFSTDNSFSIVERLVSAFPGKLFLLNNLNKGKSSAFNEAFNHSKSDFVCFMGGDDIFVPSALEARVAAVASSVEKNSFSTCKLITFSDVAKFDKILLPKRGKVGSISGGSILFPTSVANLIFPIPTILPNEDSWMMHHINFLDFHPVHCEIVGLRYRIHDGNSHRRDFLFDAYNEFLWIRSRSLFLFYTKYVYSFSNSSEHRVLRAMTLELLRYFGYSLFIIFFPGLRFFDKLRFLAISSSFLYSIKMRFYRFFVGL